MQLAIDLKTDENDVAISEIITRNDEWNEKAQKVNDFLKIKTCTYNLGLIEHKNITRNHLNNSRLHLNAAGSNMLSKNVINYINL